MCRTLKQKRIHPDRKTDLPPIRLEMGGVEEPSHLLTLNSQTQREKSSRFCLETPMMPSERWSCIVLFFFHILYRWYFLFLSYVLYTMYTFIQLYKIKYIYGRIFMSLVCMTLALLCCRRWVNMTPFGCLSHLIGRRPALLSPRQHVRARISAAPRTLPSHEMRQCWYLSTTSTEAWAQMKTHSFMHFGILLI